MSLKRIKKQIQATRNLLKCVDDAKQKELLRRWLREYIAQRNELEFEEREEAF